MCSDIFINENPQKIFLRTERLVIRPLKKQESFQLADILTHPQVMEVGGIHYSKRKVMRILRHSQTNLNDAQKALEHPRKQMFIGNIGIFHKTQLIGGLTIGEISPKLMHQLNINGISPPNTRWVSYGIALLPKYWRQGFGAEVTRRRLAFVFENLQADGILVEIKSSNYRSLELSKSFGFVDSGITLGKGETTFLILRKEDY